MSFFGANNSLAHSTPAKPSGMFSSFGTGTAGPAPGFGAPAASTAPAFGNTPGFGGGGFGQTAATSAPTLGGFGGFGATNTNTTSAAPTLGGFGTFGGANTATSAAPSLFGTTGPATSTGFGGFGTGVATSQPPAFGGFGTAATSNAGFGGFGATSTTSTAPAFGGFGTQPATGGFGSFGTAFGKPATNTTVTPGFGGFGGNTGFMMGQQQQQPTPISADEAFAQSIFNVSIYGDERDTIIAKWNYLQAMWGTGKSFYSQTAAPVDITPQNYLCRLKAMGYSRLPGKDNKVGLVALNFNKTLIEVKAQQHQITTTLNAVFGNKPNLLVNIESSKENDEKKSQLVIYVEERSQLSPNDTKRILATDLANYLNQPNVRPQLNNLGITEVLALVLPDEDQLKEYLENPPKGVDPRMWRQAKLDNPDPVKFIPVPMIGFNDLKCRIKCQENETQTHTLYLQKVENDLAELRQRHTAATAKIMEYKRKLAELSHKLLKIIVKQECTRKVGLALTPEEEALRSKLENMQALISAPTQFKGRLSELLSQMRMQRNQYALTGGSEYTIDRDCEEEMKSFLAMQQKAMEVLTDTVAKDFKALKIIIDAFGKPATNTTVTPGFGGFGGNTGFMMGQQQQQPTPISADEAFAQSIFNVSIYGDERDTIIAKWNYLQAMWGTGKSFYSQTAAPVDITPQNYLCRLKAMGYSRLPGKDNKVGLVALNFNKTLIEVKAQQHQITTTLNAVFGNKPNLLVNIESSKENDEKKSQLVIYVEERSQLSPNDTKRILATDLANYLNQPNVRPQLNNLGITEVLALVLPDEDQLKEYLENPPKGVDPRMWRQAKLDNPDPVKFIPVPMIGFNDLKCRIKCQENETQTHTLYLQKVENDLAELRQRHTAATAKIMEYKRKLAELSHKLLKIIVKQECTRKVGLALTPEEEALRSKLENMQALISAPTQFKGRLSELLSQMRMQRNQYALTGGSEYTIDKDCEEEMKSFLAMQQKAMEVLTDTVAKDFKALKIIIDGMQELVIGWK